MISGVSMEKARSELSSTSVASAKPTCERFWVPPKITSSILPPRRALVLCSPMTQRMASEILDLPEPFGPTMAVMSLSKFSTVLSGKDLKPWISSDFKYTPTLSYYNIIKIFYQFFTVIARDIPAFSTHFSFFFAMKQFFFSGLLFREDIPGGRMPLGRKNDAPEEIGASVQHYENAFSCRSSASACSAAACSARFLLVPLP